MTSGSKTLPAASLVENQQVIAGFLKSYPRHQVSAMATVLKQGANLTGEPWFDPIEPAQLANWLETLAKHPALAERELIISIRRLISFDSFDGPIAVIAVPDQPVTLVSIKSNWVRELMAGEVTFASLLDDAIGRLEDSDGTALLDAQYVPLHQTLANDLSREFFWRRFDVWMTGTGQIHEAGHNEELPKSNPWFIKRCVREFVEHLTAIGQIRGIGLGIRRTTLPASLGAMAKLKEQVFMVGVEWPSLHDHHARSIEDCAEYFESLSFDAVSVVDTPPEVDPEAKFERLHHSANAVAHLAAHLRSREEILQRVRRCVREGAKGFLIMSGGGPLRHMLQSRIMLLVFNLPTPLARAALTLMTATTRLGRGLIEFLWPGTSRLPEWFEQAYALHLAGATAPLDWLAVMQEVRTLQQQGRLSSAIAVWLVANPYRDTMTQLQAKFDRSPDALILQPPLFWKAFIGWLNKARQLPNHRPMLVGVPLISSPRNLRFWFALVGEYWWFLPWRPSFRLWLGFVLASRKGADHFASFSRAWSLDLIKRLKATKGVAGVHLMPMSCWAELDLLVASARAED